MKRLLLAIAAAFAITYATDFLVHGVWLKPEYVAAQSLWRPPTEMRTLSQHVWAIVNYVAMPVPGALAAKWFLAGTAESVLLGIVTALIYKPKALPER